MDTSERDGVLGKGRGESQPPKVGKMLWGSPRAHTKSALSTRERRRCGKGRHWTKNND